VIAVRSRSTGKGTDTFIRSWKIPVAGPGLRRDDLDGQAHRLGGDPGLVRVLDDVTVNDDHIGLGPVVAVDVDGELAHDLQLGRSHGL
jgi:hypothetical protein